MHLPPDTHLQNRLIAWSNMLVYFVIGISLLALIGWQLDLPLLQRFNSPLVSMNPMTSICFLCGSCSFIFLNARKNESPYFKTIGYILAAVVVLISGLRVIELLGGPDLAPDRLLFREKVMVEVIPGKTNRMSPNTSLAFLLMGAGLIFLRTKGTPFRRPTQYLALAVGLISLLTILSYLYQASSFFSFYTYIPMALNTGICFFLVGCAFLFSNPADGIMREFTTGQSGSMSARLLVPAAILVPTSFGLLRIWGFWKGFYNEEFGVTIYSMAIIVVFTTVAWYVAAALNRKDAKEKLIQQQLLDSEQQVKAIFSNAPDSIVVINKLGSVVRWNPESERLFGWKAEEVVGRLLTDTIIPAEFREAHMKGMQRYMQSGNSDIIGKTIEIWGVKKDGQPVDIALRISPLILNGEQLFIGFIRDITEKKDIENRLRNFNNELTHQVDDKTKEIVDIVERITDGFIALDKDFRYTYANKKIGEMTGREPSTLIGKNVWDVFPDAIGTATYDAFMKAMNDQEHTTNTDYYPNLDLWQENHIYPSENGLSVFIRDISEKKRAEREISKAWTMADKLIDSLPGVFYFYDEHGKFIRWNKQFEEVTEYTGEEIAKMHPSQFFPTEEKDYIVERITGVFEKGSNDAEAHLISKSGKKVYYYFKAVLVMYEGRPCLLGTGIDLSEQRKSAEQVRLSEQKYKLLFESNPMPMWMLSIPGWNIIEVNMAAINRYGYAREEFLQLNVFGLRPEEDIPKLKSNMSQEYRGIFHSGIWRHRKKDGTIIYVDIVTHDIMYEGQHVRLILAHEVTEQYLAEEKLKSSYESIRKLTEHLNEVREEERLHIAREIHDELGQLLTVLKMDVSWLNKKVESPSKPVKDKLQELLTLIDTTVKTVRRIASELRPSLLDDLGLLAAMEWHLEEFERRSGIQSSSSLPDLELVLPDALKIGLFRIFQESLTNVARHSTAQKVNVSLLEEDNQLILTITDDGKGFDQSKNKKKTLGLLGMKERASVMGGDYNIYSEVGMGTTVTVTVPIRELYPRN